MVELHPFDNHLAVTTNFDEILIVCTKSGEMVRNHGDAASAGIEFNEYFQLFFRQFHNIIIDGITAIDSHPTAPLIAIGTKDGFVSILEFQSIEQPTVFAEHHVCHDSIRKITFTGHVNDVIAIDQNGGIYLMEVSVCGRVDA